MSGKNGIGNPLVAASAAKLLESEAGQKAITKVVDRGIEQQEKMSRAARKTGRVVGSLVLVAGASYLGYKGIKIMRRNALMKKALSDPEVKASVDVWECIPDGFKNKWSVLTFLNPISTVSNAYSEIETLWKSANTERIMLIAKRIYEQKLNLKKIQRHFKTLYGIDLIAMLNKVLTSTQIDVFSNYVTRGSGSTKAPVEQGKLAVVKQSVHLREEPLVPAWYSANNVVRTAAARTIAGQATGREETFTDGSTSIVFVELMAYNSATNSSKYSTPVWAWKGALEFMSQDEVKRIYGNLKATDVKQTTGDWLIENSFMDWF